MNKEDIVVLFIILIFIGFICTYLMAVCIWNDIDKELEKDEKKESTYGKTSSKI